MDTNDFFEIIKNRRSIRRFKDMPVDNEDIKKIIKAATWAPSGMNRQPWKFLTIKRKNIIEELAKKIEVKLEELNKLIGSDEYSADILKFNQYFTHFRKAPVVIIVLYRKHPDIIGNILSRMGKEEVYLGLDEDYTEIQGCGAAIQNLLLSAHILGIGGCWMTDPLIARKEMEEVLGVKTPWKILALIPLGFSDGIYSMPKRKDLDQVLEFIE